MKNYIYDYSDVRFRLKKKKEHIPINNQIDDSNLDSDSDSDAKKGAIIKWLEWNVKLLFVK